MKVRNLIQCALTAYTKVTLNEMTDPKSGVHHVMFTGKVSDIPTSMLDLECNRLDGTVVDDRIQIFVKAPIKSGLRASARNIAEKSLADIVKGEFLDDNVIDVRNIQNKLIHLMAVKNHDYGNAFNKGCDTIGSIYGMSRLWDKCSRFMSLFASKEQPVVKDESLDDTISDLANYCMMYLAWKDNQKDKTTPMIDGTLLFDVTEDIRFGDLRVMDGNKDISEDLMENIDNGYLYYTDCNSKRLYYSKFNIVNEFKCSNLKLTYPIKMKEVSIDTTSLHDMTNDILNGNVLIKLDDNDISSLAIEDIKKKGAKYFITPDNKEMYYSTKDSKIKPYQSGKHKLTITYPHNK